MTENEEVISPYDLRIFPDTNVLTHSLTHMPRKTAERFAETILEGHSIDETSREQIKDKIAKEIARSFYIGAKQEKYHFDQAIDAIKKRSDAKPSKLQYYYFSLGSVCDAATVYVRESARDDNAHKGRMAQREDSLRSSIELSQKAWDNRFK
jgi:hypothetical protein